MAFCKYCGKELEEGALCSCPGAIHEAQANDLFSNTPSEATDITDTSDDFSYSDLYADNSSTNDNTDVEKNLFSEAKEIYTEQNNANSVKNSSFTESKDAHTENTAEKSPVNTVKPTPLSSNPAIRRVDTGVNNRKAKDDDSFMKFVAFVAAVLAVFVIILGCMAAGSGYKGTVKKYFRSRFSKHGGKTYYSLTLPNDGIAELKDNDLWQELVEDYNDDVEDRMDDWDKKPRFRKISKVKDMKNSELKDAEKYFCSAAEVCDADIEEGDIEIKKGYSVTYKYKNTEGDNEKTTIYVVKLKGEGWKVMSGQGTSFYGIAKND